MNKFPNLSLIGKLKTAYDLLNEALADDEIKSQEPFTSNAIVKINFNLHQLITLISENGNSKDEKVFNADYMGSDC